MNKFIGLTKRNLLIFFKDRGAVMFSMLTPVIVLMLYILFLKNNYVDSLKNVSSALMDFIKADDLDAIANGMLLSGILGSGLLTVAYNSLNTIVKDRENKIDYDISATPIKRVEIILSYFVAAFISALIMSLIILFLGILVLVFQNEMYFVAADIFKLISIVALGALTATSFFMIFMMFFKSTSTSGACFGLLSAISGFVIGAYIPLSEFSSSVRTTCNLFPSTGVTVLLRKVILRGVLNNIDTSLNGIDNGVFTSTIKDVFSFNVIFGEKTLTSTQTILYIAIMTIVFIVAIGIIYPKIYKRK